MSLARGSYADTLLFQSGFVGILRQDQSTACAFRFRRFAKAQRPTPAEISAKTEGSGAVRTSSLIPTEENGAMVKSHCNAKVASPGPTGPTSSFKVVGSPSLSSFRVPGKRLA